MNTLKHIIRNRYIYLMWGFIFSMWYVYFTDGVSDGYYTLFFSLALYCSLKQNIIDTEKKTFEGLNMCAEACHKTMDALVAMLELHKPSNKDKETKKETLCDHNWQRKYMKSDDGYFYDARGNKYHEDMVEGNLFYCPKCGETTTLGLQ